MLIVFLWTLHRKIVTFYQNHKQFYIFSTRFLYYVFLSLLTLAVLIAWSSSEKMKFVLKTAVELLDIDSC